MTTTVMFDDVAVGDTLPELSIELTPTVIVSTALATRDFQDVHHDRDLAQQRGSKDIFMNILSSTGLVERFVTDWAGSNAVVRQINIRLGAPNHPYDTMVLRGQVKALEPSGSGGIAEVELVGANTMGNHVVGTVRVQLPGKGGDR